MPHNKWNKVQVENFEFFILISRDQKYRARCYFIEKLGFNDMKIIRKVQYLLIKNIEGFKLIFKNIGYYFWVPHSQRL